MAAIQWRLGLGGRTPAYSGDSGSGRGAADVLAHRYEGRRGQRRANPGDPERDIHSAGLYRLGGEQSEYYGQ